MRINAGLAGLDCRDHRPVGHRAYLPLPSLFSIGLFAFQVMVQIAVPLYPGTFSKLGNAAGALTGMLSGIVVVAVLQLLYPLSIPWALGLTSDFVGLIVNLALLWEAAAVLPRAAKERTRLDALFNDAGDPLASRDIGPGMRVRPT